MDWKCDLIVFKEMGTLIKISNYEHTNIGIFAIKSRQLAVTRLTAGQNRINIMANHFVKGGLDVSITLSHFLSHTKFSA